MIGGYFRYPSIKVGFGSAGAAVYKAAQSTSSKVSSAMATATTGASSASPFESSAQDQISGYATLAAQAAMARINAQRKVQSNSLLKQIDSAQAQIDQAKIAAQLKQKYYVYTLPAVIVDMSTPDPTTDTQA
jgi:hypothetical protein